MPAWMACVQALSMTKRLPQLDSMRGIAALAVALTHCISAFVVDETRQFWALPYTVPPSVSNVLKVFALSVSSHAGVVFFFVLSGYVLARSLERHTNPLTYASRRVARLYPAMLLSLPVCWLVSSVFYFPINPLIHAEWLDGVWPLPLSIADLLNAAALIDFRANGVIWTIHVELRALG